MKTLKRSLAAKPAKKIVGIGASAGGLEAFTELLRSLPLDADVAYVLVQHLDPSHRSLLSELLAKTTLLRVREITDNTPIEANQIYVIPPNCDLTLMRGVLKLSPREKTGGAARSIDSFLTSLAADQKNNAIAVILSGAGSDGAQGLKAVKAAGGITFAQDDRTAKYDSMPRAAVGTGCVDFVLPPPEIAKELSRIILTPGGIRSRAAANAKRRRTLVGSRVRLGRRSAGATHMQGTGPLRRKMKTCGGFFNCCAPRPGSILHSTKPTPFSGG
ncbi:MAG TPA: chemotaxis protein CheB [Verrucomicrobiae bacterium]|nr:chemotaxis protein CheB [Verrucomicrobiae bacterium]